jgi:hypothetical protein
MKIVGSIDYECVSNYYLSLKQMFTGAESSRLGHILNPMSHLTDLEYAAGKISSAFHIPSSKT